MCAGTTTGSLRRAFKKNNCKANGTFKKKVRLVIDKTASRGRRAMRQSCCINDFQTFCVDNSEFITATTAVAASPVPTSRREGAQEELDDTIKSDEEVRRLRYERRREKKNTAAGAQTNRHGGVFGDENRSYH